MKALFICIVLLLPLVNNYIDQDQTTVRATYFGYNDDVYSFTDQENENSYEFQEVEKAALDKYNITEDKSFEGKVFKVTYKMELTEDEDGEEYFLYIIVDLELIE